MNTSMAEHVHVEQGNSGGPARWPARIVGASVARGIELVGDTARGLANGRVEIGPVVIFTRGGLATTTAERFLQMGIDEANRTGATASMR